MATLKEWDEDVANQEIHKLIERHKALKTLMEWELFKKEFSELDTLERILYWGIQKR